MWVGWRDTDHELHRSKKGRSLSLDSFLPLYDKGTSWNFLILFTFFPLVPKSGKRISMLSNCSDKGVARRNF